VEDPEICTEPLRMKNIRHQSVDMGGSEASVLEFEAVPVPPDGGWGWVVCIASFLCNMILDGTAYIFGILLPHLVKEFKSDRSTVSWVGSLLCGMYMLSGPVVGGLVNRFGTRPVCISGSILAWAAISVSTLSANVWMMMVLYGVVGGFGLGLVYLPAVISVGHYFESKRALATGIAVCGSGVGTFLFAPLASYLVTSYSWQTSNLVFASFFAVCIVCGLVMKPLVLPPNRKEIQRLTLKLPDGTKNTEKRNLNSSGEDSRLAEPLRQTLEVETGGADHVPELVSHNPGFERNYSAVHLSTLRPRRDSGFSKSMSTNMFKPSPSQNRLAKPFERKDIFFSGSITNFDNFGELVVRPNKSFISMKDGIGEPFLSRTSLFNPQLQETTTISSVLKSMMNFSLLKEKKFLLVSISNMFGFLGFYVPFMYLPSLVKTNLQSSEEEAALVLSVIGIFNTLGRVLTGWVADQPWADALILTSTSLVLSSVCVVVFPFITSYPLFLVLSGVFGLFVAAYISLTSIMLVDLVGLEHLTTAFGLVTMFRGGAAILGPPLAGAVFDATQSFLNSFLMAGAFFAAAGFFSFAAHFLRKPNDSNS